MADAKKKRPASKEQQARRRAAAEAERKRQGPPAHAHRRGPPYPELPAPVVASAWEHQVRLDSSSDPRLERFISEYRNGPQTPEPGAACTGNGTPLP